MATKTEKAPNYTPEMIKQMITLYKADADQETRTAAAEALADHSGKSVASIRAKLTREKNEDGTQVYIPKVYKTKAGGDVKGKEDMATEIADRCGVAPELFDTLAKANKSVLSTITYKLESMGETISQLQEQLDIQTGESSSTATE